MKTIKILVGAIFITVSLYATTSFAWTKVYANDQNGIGTYGSITALVDAVTSGKKVRYKTFFGNGVVVRDAERVSIDYGYNPPLVYAENSAHVPSYNDNGIVKVAVRFYRIFEIATTHGTVSWNRYYVDDNSTLGPIDFNWPMEWFVE